MDLRSADVFSQYFCIFCSNSLPNIQDAYEHYKGHMSYSSYCKICDKVVKPGSNERCTVNHKSEDKGSNLEAEQGSIEMWIERFLTYQEELIDKPYANIISSTKFFLGCPVCDQLIRICNVIVPKEATQLAAQSQEIQESVHANNDSSSSSSSREAKEQVKCHTVRHACAHLRYYPYECFVCEQTGRYQKKPDISEMMRHIKDNHPHSDKNDKSVIDTIIKQVRITKLEKFIDCYLKSRPMVRFDPIINPNKSPSMKPTLVDNLRARKLAPKNLRSMASRSSNEYSPEVKTTTINITTQSDGSNVSIRAQSRITSNYDQRKSNLNKLENIKQKQESYSVPYFRDKLAKNLPMLPSNQQFSSLKTYSNFIPNNASSESNQTSFQRHFGNIFDDEDMIKFPFNQEEDLNVEYFCIFCPETFKDKDEARRHYQKHVNYYPMMCSLCGEGATDMQEFLRHHTEVHPNAEKGRYKRKEQPIVEKWINGFLYAQATIIRAFPPREQCPVCDRVFTEEQIKAARPRRCTVNRKIDHVHRHLCYLPYECVKCKEEGKEFLVAYFESKAHSHIKLKHPEIDDTESRWFIFQKTITIPKLDEHIANYLTKFGISMEYERRPIKKQSRESFSSPDFLSVYKGNSVMQPNLSNALIPYGEKSLSTNPGIYSHQQLTHRSDIFSNNNDGIIILDGDEDADLSLADSSVASEEANDGNSMIVAVSPSHAEYIESGKNSRKHSQEYFCLFCNAKFSCKLEAYPHYGEHLEYKPVLCLLCDNKFHDIDAFTLHHQRNHIDATDLMYEIREDQNIEKWVDEFLESQLSPNSKRLILNCSCGACCPVCDKQRTKKSIMLSQCFLHTDVLFSDHIHKHLAYYAYECSLCRKIGRITRVPNLDAIALNHVKEHHFVKEASVYQLSKTFPKTLTIVRLEKFIAESVQKKRNLEKKWKSLKNEQLKIEKLKMQQLQAQSTFITPLQYPSTNGTTGVMNDNSHSRNSSLLSRLSPSNSNIRQQVAHVRIEGGRVVNLPSSLSIRAIQQKNHKKTIDLTKDTSKEEEGTMSLSTGVRFYVKCLHCNLELPNRKQLKIHHVQEHPGLSMACFTTPKPLLAASGSS